MRRALLALLLLLAPLPAGAESIAWSPPPVGLTTVFDGDFMGSSLEVVQRVVEVNGDEVVVESLPPGGPPYERYFRFLLSYESEGALYQFDDRAAAQLWPLEPGKTAAGEVRAMMQGMPMTFDWHAEVTAIEEVTVPAGSFRAARVEHSLIAPGLLTLETVTWLAAEHGVPLRTETTVTLAGEAPMAFTLVLRALR